MSGYKVLLGDDAFSKIENAISKTKIVTHEIEKQYQRLLQIVLVVVVVAATWQNYQGIPR